jgi:hypothetical protein
MTQVSNDSFVRNDKRHAPTLSANTIFPSHPTDVALVCFDDVGIVGACRLYWMHNSSGPTVTHRSNDLQTTRCTSCPDPETERFSNHDSHIISMTSLVTTPTTHAPYTVIPHHSNNTHTYKYLRGIYLQSYIYSTTL